MGLQLCARAADPDSEPPGTQLLEEALGLLAQSVPPRKLEAPNVTFRHEGDFGALRAWTRYGAPRESSAERDHDLSDLNQIDYGVERERANGHDDSRLFERLARCGLLQSFADLEKATRHGPLAAGGLMSPPAHQKLAVSMGETGHDDLGVLIVCCAAGWARRARPRVKANRLQAELRAAFAAVLDAHAC
jgi:hypothetical protein